MALERQDLREELVAVIAAGRELSPAHDYALADVFLDHVRRHGTSQERKPRWLDDPERLRTLLTGAGVALAALLFSFFVLAAFHGGNGFGRRDFGPGLYLRGPDGGWPPPLYGPSSRGQFPQPQYSQNPPKT
jgi:hypothetical protein